MKFSYSVKHQLNSPRKIFLVDSAFNQICGANFSENKGKIVENMVFIELKRRKKDVFYYAKKNECDFITKEGTKITEAIQVCYTLNKENREREIAGLLEAIDEFKLKRGLMLTNEQTEEISIGNKKIIVLPISKWLLE
ncbi:ATP-binding protein [Candidatus Woesearchaeota archaeon]|nr:ATP-binding protein [Candidatus Woesearchaeota archaeon]